MANEHDHSSDVTKAVRVLEVAVVTPEATVVQSPAQFVAVPLFDGEIGIAPGHSPFIGRLGYGELRIVEGGRTRSYYVDGGFVEVANDQVSVLTNSALPAEQLDLSVAQEHLAAARARKANSTEELAIRYRAEQQARAQVRLAEKSEALAH